MTAQPINPSAPLTLDYSGDKNIIITHSNIKINYYSSSTQCNDISTLQNNRSVSHFMVRINLFTNKKSTDAVTHYSTVMC